MHWDNSVVVVILFDIELDVLSNDVTVFLYFQLGVTFIVLLFRPVKFHYCLFDKYRLSFLPHLSSSVERIYAFPCNYSLLMLLCIYLKDKSRFRSTLFRFISSLSN